MTDEYPFREPWGGEYVRPAPAVCPNCPCCTLALCEAGRADVFGCLGRLGDTDPEIRQRVAACPCSAETTEGTEAHRAAQVRAAKRAELAGGES